MDEMEFVTKAISEKSILVSVLSPVSEKIYHFVQIRSQQIGQKGFFFLQNNILIRRITFLWGKTEKERSHK